MLLLFLKTEIKRAFSRWQILVAFFLLVLLFIQGIETFRPETHLPGALAFNNFYVAFLYAQGMGASAILPGVLPLIIALAAGDSMAWDRRSGYQQFILMRISRGKYIIGKLLSASLISVIFIFVSEIFMLIYTFASFPNSEHMQHVNGITPKYASNLFIEDPFLYILLIILNTSLLAMVVSAMSVMCSIFSKNIYAVIVIPWIFFFLLQFIFYNINLAKFAPIDLVGLYMNSIFQYSIIEIPFIWITLWLLLCCITYLVFIRSYKARLLS
ncbi:hypothetical protein JQN58_11910 [Aneurinibacillus sp. BA2021]|nr:hypothetical protein [Aneurinibacillus sp. BA2021]